MARLNVLAWMLLMLSACSTTVGTLIDAPTSVPANAVVDEIVPIIPEPESLPLISPRVPQLSPPAHLPWVSPSWDAEDLSFGWIDLASWSRRLGVDGRFWTQEKVLWKQVRASAKPLPEALYPLTKVFQSSTSDQERFWAAYGIYRLYRDAGLQRESQPWRERAQQLKSVPLLVLDQAWDLAFVSHERDTARILWPSIGSPELFEPSDASRYRLLRQELFSGELSLVPLGIDPYVSSLAVDRDDLWVGTWNGALARVSLVTGTWSVLGKPAVQIAPIRLVRINRFFVYVFREQGFSRYSKVTGGWREFGYPAGWSGLRIQDVVLTGDEAFWLVHLGQGLWSWDSGNWQSHAAGAPSSYLNVLAPGPEGSLLVGTQDQGLWRWWNETWDKVRPTAGRGPDNISALVRAPRPEDNRWAVGTYGQGLWMTDGMRLTVLSNQEEFVTAIEWNGEFPWWSVLDQGLWHGDKAPWEVLGLRDGLVDPSATTLVSHGGRLYWGTTGRSIQFWSEDDDPMVYR